MKKEKMNRKKRTNEGNKLSVKAALAFEHEFYLEALWIVSSMIEKKLKKMLEKIENITPGAGYSLEQSVKRLKHLHITSKHVAF